MTDEQRRQIRKMRKDGLGYKKIAKALKMHRDSVRDFCQRNGINGLASEYKIRADEMAGKGAACLNCGLELDQDAISKGRRYCCERCRKQYWYIKSREKKGHSHR